MQRRSARLLAVSAVLLAGALPAASLSGAAFASTPAGSSLSVPTTPGGSVSARWTGTIPAGANPNSDCTTDPSGTALEDPHALTIVVPAGAYSAVTATLTVQITWAPASPGGATTSDEILTLVGPGGKVVGSSDTSNPQETVSVADPVAGTYTALACGFVNSTPQPYAGTATLTSAARPAPGALPLVDPQGLQFSATVPADPQRDEGEPAVTTDRSGNIYTCGPTGFSSANDYAQVSTDGGDQFHLLGTPPRGQLGTVEAGGDCALAVGQQPNGTKTNGKDNYTLAYAGLGPLTNFSTATSRDTGRSLATSALSESVPGVDRQWIAFSDASTAYLNYNQELLNKVVQKSTDGGLTYGPVGVVAADEGGRIGQIRVIPKSITGTGQDFVYFPYSVGTKVKIALSQDSGATFSQCVAVDAGISPDAGFVTADHDDQGNVYVTYTEKGGGRDTYLVSIPFARFKGCKGTGTSAANVTNPGFSPKLRLNRGGIETTVMPWLAASGEPGKVAVAFYGTREVGDPDSGTFKASWNVYVAQVLNALDPTPSVAQVQASTHPFHYDSICLNGLGCTVSGGDRSLVDYFTIDYNRGTGALSIVYSQAGKRPGDPAGVLSTPAVVTQIGGPSNGGGMVHRPDRAPLRSTSSDPVGDAISNYSLATPAVAQPNPRAANVDALDLTDRNNAPAVSVSPRLGGGMTVTMRYKDLSNAALQTALTSTTAGTPGSLVYIFRFFNGYRPAAAVATYDAIQGWRFGFNGYDTQSAPCLGTKAKCLVYPGTDKPLDGKVDQAAGTITLSVPLSYLTALGSGLATGPYPGEVPAVAGSRLYDATAFTFVNDFPQAQTQSFMQAVDNAPAMDLLVPPAVPPAIVGTPGPGTPTAGGPGGGGGGSGSGNGSGTRSGTAGRANLAATGGLPLALAGLLALAVGATLRRHPRLR
jgi:hypothetical protein